MKTAPTPYTTEQSGNYLFSVLLILKINLFIVSMNYFIKEYMFGP